VDHYFEGSGVGEFPHPLPPPKNSCTAKTADKKIVKTLMIIAVMYAKAVVQ